MNEGNLVSRLNNLATGDSYLKEMNIPLSAVRQTAAGLTLGPDGGTAATVVVPTMVVGGISFDDGETALLRFLIPQDYAENIDKIALRLVETPSASAADTTDLGITTAQTIYRAGVAPITTASTAKAEVATSSSGALTRENVLNISGRGYKPGDVVELTLDGNNSSTTEIILNGIGLIYASTVRAYNDDDLNRM